jgi:4,5-dihydroxyphthalate decarboxylase
MSVLRLSMAIGNYDRTRPLFDGDIAIDGIEPIFLKLEPEEMFFRAFRHQAFDVCELSLSSFVVKLSQGDCPYVGVPVFLSRAFRHNAIYVRTDRGIRAPADLKGRRVGIGEYQLTACVWARILLEDDYGVRPNQLQWVRGGVETPDRPEKISVKLPPDVRIESAPPGVTIDQLLEAGELDAFVGPRAPPCFERRNPLIARLFADPRAEATGYYSRTGIFPIMHVLGVHRSVVQSHPWVPATLRKAFERSRQMAFARLNDASAPKVMLPFVEEQLQAASALMGANYWSYGIGGNRHVLDVFLRHHHGQGLSEKQLAVDELFHPSTFEAASI